MLEHLHRAPELSLKLQHLGIDGAVLDLDDTLFKTNTLFLEAINQYLETVSKDLLCAKEGLRPRFIELNTAAFHGPSKVAPERWDEVVAGLIETYGHQDIFSRHLPILYSIYQQTPLFLYHAELTLRALKDARLPIAIVTHANVTWTHLKIEQRRLADYVDYVWIADEHQPKSEADWGQAIDSLGIRSDHCLGVGDSIISDMVPLAHLGVRYRVHIPSPCTFYRVGNLPPDTKTISGIDKLIDTIMTW
jgi:phosphoglycolate phosphatase-like HAD superfamily hydrolase